MANYEEPNASTQPAEKGRIEGNLFDNTSAPTQGPEQWKTAGDLFDGKDQEVGGEQGPATQEEAPINTASKMGQVATGDKWLRPSIPGETSTGQGRPLSDHDYDVLNERAAMDRRPRPASPPRPEQPRRRRPRSSEADDNGFFDDPLGRSGGSGTIG